MPDNARFIARRGRPKAIYSDNGTNMVGAERELRESLKKMSSDRVASHLLQKKIEWNFNPPYASHMGDPVIWVTN